jgi:hypothetical protein
LEIIKRESEGEENQNRRMSGAALKPLQTHPSFNPDNSLTAKNLVAQAFQPVQKTLCFLGLLN